MRESLRWEVISSLAEGMHGRLFVNFFTWLFKEWYSIVLKISHLSARLLTEFPDFRFSYCSFPAICQLWRKIIFVKLTHCNSLVKIERGLSKWDGILITIKIKNFCFDFPLRTIVHLRSNIYFPSRCSIRYPSEIPVIFQPSPRYGVWTRGWKLRFMFD